MNLKTINFVFLILNYINIDDTINCVKTIMSKCSNYNYKIVIVDNGSNNKSCEKLNKIYKGNEKVKLIKSQENLGFAKGNNLGFKYIKDNLYPDFIIMCNSDTNLLQDDFLELVYDEFKKSKFDVLGPKILLPSGKINNVKLKIPTKIEVKKMLACYKREYITSLLFIYKPYLFFKNSLKKIMRKKNIKQRDVNKRYENIVLHGSFLIFSKKYIDMFDGIDDRTFLYKEEELLAIRLKRNNLLSIYNPDIIIFHNEDGSLNSMTKSSRKKRLFVCKYLIESSKILLNEIY